MVFPRAALLAVVFAAVALSPAPPASAQVEIRLNKIDSYIPTLAHKKAMNRAYRDKVGKLREELHRRQLAGEGLACSAQILQEVHWLVNYTTRRADVERRLADLRRSLSDGKPQDFANRQDPRDGSFGPCFEEWIWRFASSVDPLKELALKGLKPGIPLKIWAPVDTPEEIRAYMDSLLISDAAEGRNRRKELNMAVDTLGQLLWLDSTASVFPASLDRKQLAGALTKFVDERWQDPETGYWGAWFRERGEIRKTNDLSMTFHIVSYRGGDVRLRKQIAQTTFAIRHVPYPYGWDGGGLQNNHHAYDVVRIVNLTWSDLDRTQQSVAKAFLMLLTARSLAMSIDGKGAFDVAPYSTAGEAYYFGVSFFVESGLLGRAASSDIKVTNTQELMAGIGRNLEALDAADPMVSAARKKLALLRPAL
jgi:hypothetical protein